MSVDEATRVVQEILSMEVNQIITKEQALVAIKKVPHCADLLVA